MLNYIGNLAISLILTMSVIVLVAYLITRTHFFNEVLERHYTFRNRLFTILFFGALSIFGTYGGVELPTSAIANLRDLGPLIAGLFGGPLIGLGAGLIGGIHRYFMGNFVALPCGLASVVAGLVGGYIFYLRKGQHPKIWQIAIIAACMEVVHSSLTLILATPFEKVWETTVNLTIPMMTANAIGSSIFSFIIINLVREKKTAAEKEKIRRELERKKVELDAARQIQLSFLPESTPVLREFQIGAFSLPALEVGGDYYDFIPISEGKWGLVIGDVSGKGFPAALFMAVSRICIRSNAMGGNTASEAIIKANRIISQDSSSGMFITLFYSVLDLQNRKLRYVNAGHNPPIVLSGNGPNHGGSIKLLEAKGIALGVLDDIELEEMEMDLNPDDIIVFYTDGVTEAINAKNEQFGETRLAELISMNRHLSATDLVDKIKNVIMDFTRGEPQFDDFTLFALKVSPGAGPPSITEGVSKEFILGN
ncbi:MAG: SpoIIE family protein phosphatase [Dehalococcoidales bacterium]|nr:SpoIIE family protein phosphatase [Dehalococcoidales bacterium]